MKLFRIDYLEDDDHECYLTVGNDGDTEDSIKERELNKRDDWNCLYYLFAREVREVDGHRIIVEE